MRKLYTKVVIAENERGLLFRRGSFIRILDPGVHRIQAVTAKTRAAAQSKRSAP